MAKHGGNLDAISPFTDRYQVTAIEPERTKSRPSLCSIYLRDRVDNELLYRHRHRLVSGTAYRQDSSTHLAHVMPRLNGACAVSQKAGPETVLRAVTIQRSPNSRGAWTSISRPQRTSAGRSSKT